MQQAISGERTVPTGSTAFPPECFFLALVNSLANTEWNEPDGDLVEASKPLTASAASPHCMAWGELTPSSPGNAMLQGRAGLHTSAHQHFWSEAPWLFYSRITEKKTTQNSQPPKNTTKREAPTISFQQNTLFWLTALYRNSSTKSSEPFSILIQVTNCIYYLQKQRILHSICQNRQLPVSSC